MENVSYIEKCYSLSKQSWESPWRIEISHPFDAEKKLVYYLADENVPGGFYEERPVIAAAEKFSYILTELHKRIERYPYFWPLEGEKIDYYGYDFYTYLTKESDEADAMEIGMTEVADTIARDKMAINDPEPEVWKTLTAEDYVEGKGIGVRMTLTLEKAASVNHVALELFSSKDVELASFLYQEDDSQYVPMKELDLKTIGVAQSKRSLDVRLPKAVFAKRIVLILTQKEYVVNKYKLPKNVVAQRKILKHIKEEEAKKTSLSTGSRQYVTDYKSEQFADLFVKAGLSGWAKLMERYREDYKKWLGSQKN